MMTQLITKLFIFIIGASIGSFLNILIDRLPNEESINGRSHCDFCKKKLPWFDLFPIFSFLTLRGKCRYCHKKLSWQYPVIEMLTGVAFLLIFNQISNFKFQILNLVVLWGITSCLIVIFVSDLKYRLISDYIQVTFFIFSVIYRLLSANFFSFFPYFLISSLVVALPIWLIYFLSKERAMGLGDVYLSAIVGFLLGWQAGFIALYIAFVTGAIFGLFLILLKRKKFKSQVPFGPFIVIGTVTMMFWGEKIMEVIKNIYRF